MVFSGIPFLYVFLPLLLLCYYATPFDGVRRGVLTVFSLLFYAWGEPVYLFLMLLLVGADYLFGRLLVRENCRHRRGILTAAVVSNLTVLVVFKYTSLAVSTVNLLPGVALPDPGLALPIGISFFTFQTMSYVIDVYRGDVRPQRSYFRLLLYVSFFPQLIAGPIVRYREIEEQLEVRRVALRDFLDGFFRFAVGLSKKVLIADACAVAVESFYGFAGQTVLSAWSGAVFFTLQLYFDFSGYSDMAIGLGMMFGFQLPENFRYPLCARSAQDFWRRWHITLGSFFRDYVYIPLGGNRSHWLRNVLIVWALTGLWHGASWNFLLWGLWYGLLLVLEKKVLSRFFRFLPGPVSAVLSHLYTAFVTVFGFVIFYFDTGLLSRLGYLFGVGVTGFSGVETVSALCGNVILLAGAVFFATPACTVFFRRLSLPPAAERVLKTVFTVGSFVLSTVCLAGNSYSPFLYFRF